MIRKKSVSIKDIAKVANVSYSTVSRALRDNDLVNPQTRARILHWAKKLSYSTNAIARGLATQQTHMVGLVVTTIADPFLGEVVDGIEKRALKQDFSVLLSNCRSDPQQELATIRLFKERRVDGILIISGATSMIALEELRNIEIPIVLINNLSPVQADQDIYTISIDNFRAARTAVGHLTSLGHQRIAYVTDETGGHSNQDRMGGYRVALLEAELPFLPQLVVEGDGTAEGGMVGVKRLLADRKHSFTALFCYNDESAIGALKALKLSGLRVPEDVSVVGVDDIFVSPYIDLTTVRQPKFQMGGMAMEMMLKLIKEEGIVSSIRVGGELVVRGTTCPP